MNILAELNWIKEYVSTTLSPKEIERALSLHAFSVEKIIDWEEKLSGVVVGEILSIESHPEADKLSIAKVNIGDQTKQILFGQTLEVNVGQKVPVAVAPCKLPGGITIKSKELRGQLSEGMLCLDQELGLLQKGVTMRVFEPHVQNGTPIAKALALGTVFDIEITTNRPDGMSIIGLARELSAITKSPFSEPTPPPISTEVERSLPLSAAVEEPSLCPRYQAVAIKNIKVAPSPAWLQARLLQSGHRPINNIVDITNFILHEYGQPLHAFDYDKITGPINIRKAQKGEKFLALDEEEYELSPKNLVIADDSGPIAVAGVMGGQKSGTWNETVNIVIESANFDPVFVRRSARALNLYSDSQLIFEKGISPEQTSVALNRAVELILEIAGGEVASEIIDARSQSPEAKTLYLNPDRVRSHIGADMENSEMVEVLERLGFAVDTSAAPYKVTVPYWRDLDMEGDIDLTEEVARLFGYHNIPTKLLTHEQPLAKEDPQLAQESAFRHHLAATGHNELFSYSFISEQDLTNIGADPEQTFRVLNPLSEDLTYMRPSLIPSVLNAIEKNQGLSREGRVFELSRIYSSSSVILSERSESNGPPSNTLPVESTQVTIVHYGFSDFRQAYQKLRGDLETFFGTDIKFQQAEIQSLHPGRTAEILLRNTVIGHIGQASEELQSAFGIKSNILIADINLELALSHWNKKQSFTGIPEFPSVKRDVAIFTENATAFEALSVSIKKQSPLITDVDLIEEYHGDGVPPGDFKGLTLSVELYSKKRTLTQEDIEIVMKRVADVLVDSHHAIIR